jgi:serine/threonine protein kinase
MNKVNQNLSSIEIDLCSQSDDIELKFTKTSNWIENDETKDGLEHLNEYHIEEYLGKGTFGVVKSAFYYQYNNDDIEEKNYVALKIMSKTKLRKCKHSLLTSLESGNSNSLDEENKKGFHFETSLERLFKEIDILILLNHDNIILLYEVLYDFNI